MYSSKLEIAISLDSKQEMVIFAQAKAEELDILGHRCSG